MLPDPFMVHNHNNLKSISKSVNSTKCNWPLDICKSIQMSGKLFPIPSLDMSSTVCLQWTTGNWGQNSIFRISDAITAAVITHGVLDRFRLDTHLSFPETYKALLWHTTCEFTHTSRMSECEQIHICISKELWDVSGARFAAPYTKADVRLSIEC